MSKESNSLNENNDSSNMLSITQNTQGGEELISNEEHANINQQSYEDKLNEKLKEMGLYEEGMTFSQKEELLAAIFASLETAEKEKSKREFIEEYMKVSEAFCHEQLEDFQEYPENCNDLSPIASTSKYLDITLTEGTIDDPASSVDFEAICSENKDNSTDKCNSNETISDSSLENLEVQATFRPFELLGLSSSQTNSSDERYGAGPSRKLSAKVGPFVAKIDELKPADVVYPIHVDGMDVVNAQETQEHSRQQLKGFRECLSAWRPCLSPKESPMICSKKPWLNEREAPQVSTEKAKSKKISRPTTALEVAIQATKDLRASKATLSKPYLLQIEEEETNQAIYKRAKEPDVIDIMVGSSSGELNRPSQPGFTTYLSSKTKPFSRTSGGAFRYVQSYKTKSVTSSKVQTGQPIVIEDGLESTSSEKVFRPIAVPHADFSSADRGLNERSDYVNFNGDGTLEEKLPTFNSLKPKAIKGTAVPGSDLKYSAKLRTFAQMSSVVEAQNHVGKLSSKDSDSDSSSVVDVESNVDAEIKEFVSKRKMAQESHSSNEEKEVKQRKRLKENTS